MTHQLAPWRIDRTLTPRPVLLEASAGTGKTWNITAIVMRLVAEAALPIADILVVTFTKAATAELRARIRAELGRLSDALTAPSPEPGTDAVLALLADCPPDERTRRARRLRVAAESFDAASIFTIHGFCQRVLAKHAFEAGARLEATLLEDTSALLEEIVDDFLSRERHQDVRLARFVAHTCRLDRDKALKLARAVTHTRDALLGPELVEADDGEQAPVSPMSGPEVLAAWDAASRPVADAWRRGGRDAVEAFFARCAEGRILDQRSYRPTTVNKRIDEVDAWLTAEPGVAIGCDIDLKCLTPERMIPLKNKQLPPIPAVLHALVELPLLAQRLSLAMRLYFARHAREQLQTRMARQNAMSFDDLLVGVADRLRATGADGELARALRETYQAALIDEFQDTDSVQWAIFETVFARDRYLFLIGDPKQAIYGFRGADIFVYRGAAHSVADRCTLDTNHRSDPSLVEAIGQLYLDREGIFVDDDAIGFPEVGAAKPERIEWPAAAPTGLDAPLGLRWFDGDWAGRDKAPSKGLATRLLTQTVANDVRDLLEAPPTLSDGKDRRRPAGPGDVAILVRTNRQARLLHRALTDRAIPAVISSAGSVYDSEEATWLERWLAALDERGKDGPARALAATPLFGWRADEMIGGSAGGQPSNGGQQTDGAAERRWAAWMDKVRRWRERFEARGFIVAWEHALADADPRCEAPAEGAEAPMDRVHRETDGGGDGVARLLALEGGERHLTNLRHLAELAHQAWLRDRLSPAGLLHWLRERRHKGEEAGEGAELRLETDADAVRIVTVHKSKGLQYPIVFVPFFWDGSRLGRDGTAPLHYHERLADGGFAVRLDLGLDTKSTRRMALREAAAREAHEENLRLLYVALTRAVHQCVVYWGLAGGKGGSGSDCSPLAHLLHGDSPGDAPTRRERAEAAVRAALGGKDPDAVSAARAALVDHLERLAATSRGRIALAHCEPPPRQPVLWRGPATPAASPTHEVRVFERDGLDLSWRRLSYTALTRGKDIALEPTPQVGADADALAKDTDGDAPALTDAWRWPDRPVEGDPVPLDTLRSGKEAGTWVHAVFEQLDFRPAHDGTLRERAWDAAGAPTAGREALALIGALGVRNGFPDAAQHELLADVLPSILRAPLGGPVGDLALADLPLTERLDELQFDFTLAHRAGGAYGTVDGDEIRRALHLRADPSPFWSRYLASLDEMRFGAMRGWFTGSIDLVFRDRVGRYYVLDYKTNRIVGQRPTDGARAVSRAGHYRRDFLEVEMARHNYVLQYHFYLVALHRYLRTRIRDYDYDTHVGGAYYAFIRGMSDTEAPGAGPLGVFFDAPPARVIAALSDCFDRAADERLEVAP